MKLLTRTVFRETVLARNNNVCCVPDCALQAVDAHHILNRRLFNQPHEKEGYFYENGAQLCSTHHFQAELTQISVEELREWCNIPVCLPEQLDPAKIYDCWGNEIIENNFRKPGLLFNDDGFQKVLKTARIGWLFLNY